MKSPQKAAGWTMMSNIRFVLSLVMQYKKSALVYTLINTISKTFSTLAIVLTPKLIVDQLLADTINLWNIVIILLLTGGLSFAFQNIAFWAETRFSSDIIWFKTIIKAGNKFMTMDFPKTEDPEILSLSMRTEEVLKNAGEGVYGVLTLLFELSSFIMPTMTMVYILCMLSPVLVLIFVFVILVNFFIIKNGSRKKLINTEKVTLEKRIVQYIHNFMYQQKFGKDLRLFHMSRYLHQKYDENNEKVDESEIKNSWIELRCSLITCITTAVQEICLYFYLISSVVIYSMPISNFIFYFGASRSFCQSFQNIVKNISKLRSLSLGITIIRNFLDMESCPTEGCGPVSIDTEHMEISFCNVSFRYPGHDHYTIQNLSFSLKRGESLALVGRNGAGKTTLVKLMMRLYDPTEGTIKINGIDIRSIPIEEYYRLFSPVFQNIELYAMSLAENISMRPLEETDKERVHIAIKKANLTSMLDKLPNGIETQVLKVMQTDGVEFSGGEEQRIAIARAAYKDAPCLILDEPTAALDPLAELALYKDFNELTADKLTVFISHRLASATFCNKVILLEHGKLLEYGTHEQLLSQKGKYYAMFESQAQYYRSGGEKKYEPSR